jgi:hypothetical protein
MSPGHGVGDEAAERVIELTPDPMGDTPEVALPHDPAVEFGVDNSAATGPSYQPVDTHQPPVDRPRHRRRPTGEKAEVESTALPPGILPNPPTFTSRLHDRLSRTRR